MVNIKCLQCGLVNFSDASDCRRCGASLSFSDPASGGPFSHYPPPVQNPPYTPPGLAYAGAQGATAYSTPYAVPYNQPPSLRQGFAITALALGIGGLIICPAGVLTAIPGLVFGIVAVVKANKYPTEYGGKGMAIAGIVMNGLLVFLIPIIAAIAIPNLIKAIIEVNEAIAIEQMREIALAQSTYQSDEGGGVEFATKEELVAAGYLTWPDEMDGYRFTIRVVRSARNKPASFQAVAVPVDYGWDGRRSFYVDESYVIRYADKGGREADVYDEPIAAAPRLRPGRDSLHASVYPAVRLPSAFDH
ncbi:MAG: DUF4190 domain-containing protein [Blastocatellia bacterium]|nr:DUF4190 domain-containing protein [Blastocatellia bacterium]